MTRHRVHRRTPRKRDVGQRPPAPTRWDQPCRHGDGLYLVETFNPDHVRCSQCGLVLARD